MLASQEVARQLPEVVRSLRDRMARMAAGVDRAGTALGAWGDDREATDEAISSAMAGDPRPFALSLEESPSARFPAPRFAPCTVVAADGSSIPIDRHGPLPCYVVNIGTVILPYGLAGEPSLSASARVGPLDGTGDPDVSAGGLDLLRDVCELEAAALGAAARVAHGPVVAVLDGTLLPWDLDSPRVDPAVRSALRQRTADALALLRGLDPPAAVGAYVSASRAADVVTSLRCLVEHDAWWPVSDALLFRVLLSDGERSAVFRARSERRRRVEEQFGPSDQVCFFYLRVEDDIARVELPLWACSQVRVDRLHAALVDQARRCDGYPRALQEAHEQAVVSGSDRALFARLLEKEALSAGVRPQVAGKAASKRRRSL